MQIRTYVYCTIALIYKYSEVFIFSYITLLSKQAFLHKNVITLLHIFKKQKFLLKNNCQTIRMDYNTDAKYQFSNLKFIKCLLT